MACTEYLLHMSTTSISTGYCLVVSLSEFLATVHAWACSISPSGVLLQQRQLVVILNTHMYSTGEFGIWVLVFGKLKNCTLEDSQYSNDNSQNTNVIFPNTQILSTIHSIRGCCNIKKSVFYSIT